MREAFVSIDQAGAITGWNPAAERLFGWSRSEVLGRRLASTIVPARRRAQAARLLAPGQGWTDDRRLEVTALHRDGGEFPAALTISPMQIENQNAFGVFLHDIGPRRRLEQYLRSQNAVNEALVRAAPLPQTMSGLISELGEALNCGAAEMWWVDEESDTLLREQVWTAACPADSDLEDAAGGPVRFARGEGLAGRVWDRGEPTFVPDVTEDPDFRHVELSDALGVRAAFCLPVENDGRTIGVLEFFFGEAMHEEVELLRFLSQISNQIAIYIERERARDNLAREGRFLNAVLESMSEGVVACDQDGILTVFNRVTRELHGLPEQPLPPEQWTEHYGLRLPDWQTPVDKEEIPLFRALRGEQVREAEVVITLSNGDRRLVRVNGRPVMDPDGTKLGAVVAMHDITAHRRAEDDLAHQALHDPLTGLPNRLVLSDRISHALLLTQRLSSKVAVLFLDIDNFKQINDTLGHLTGDRLLISFAARLQEVLRSSDTTGRPGGETLARFGGDGFVVVCEGVQGEKDAVRIAERIAAGLTVPFSVGDDQLTVTASIGIAVSCDPEATPESLIRDADMAMYRAKKRGRDRYEVFDEEMRSGLAGRLRLENDLRTAIEQEQLRLHYQPIFAVSDQPPTESSAGDIAGVEALVRWQHPQRGLLSPAEFIPMAEENGMIVPLGNWVLEEASRQWRAWRIVVPGWRSSRIWVNVSTRQVTAALLKRFSEGSIDPSRLNLEITENLFLGDPAAAAHLRSLKELGAELTLDDFGTGYSSLGYLTRFPIDTLKLDRSFVSEIDRNPQAHTIIAATITMAHGLGMKVVAEGVETREQHRRLQDLGCDFAQGFLFSRPLQAEAATRLMTVDQNRHDLLPGSQVTAEGAR